MDLQTVTAAGQGSFQKWGPAISTKQRGCRKGGRPARRWEDYTNSLHGDKQRSHERRDMAHHVFYSSVSGDIMSDVARDSSGEGSTRRRRERRLRSWPRHELGNKNGCGRNDAPLLKGTEDCRSRARRPTWTLESSCGGGRDHPQERISKLMVEHIVDMSVPQVFDEVADPVDVPMPQVVEQVVEVVRISPERVMEHIVFEVSPTGAEFPCASGHGGNRGVGPT